MELHIQSEFDCVYYINGEFFERADCLTMSEFDVAYVTVFPLKHTLLPYTVRLRGAENVKSELACGVRLSPDHYLLSLAPRHMTVYASTFKPTSPLNPISRLYSLVRSGELDAAYSMLSAELKSSIDKNTLGEFFSDCERIVECRWEGENKFYKIDKNSAVKLCEYTLKDEFIDDITEN